MAFWLDIAAFALKSLAVVAALGGLVGVRRHSRPLGCAARSRTTPRLTVRSLNERYDAMRDAIERSPSRQEGAQGARQSAQEGGEGRRKGAAERAQSKRVYVLAFKGDLQSQRGQDVWRARSTPS